MSEIAKRNRRRKVTVDLVVLVGETTHNRRFTGSRASVQMWDSGRAKVTLVDGFDEHGPVICAHFRRAEEIIRRPAKRKRS